MKEVTFEQFKLNLKKHNNVLSIKYIDGNRYYFSGARIVAKIIEEKYFTF